jgi:hypothetical protein
MIRTASLAALCAFGLSNVAHASFALTQVGASDVVAGFTTLESGAGAPAFSTTPVLLGSDGVSLSGGAQAINTIATPTDSSGSLQIVAPGGALSLTDLNFNTITGSLYSQILGSGNVTIAPGAITVTSPLITSGDGVGSGSTLTVAPPAPTLDVQPFVPPEGGWVTPPFFPTPAPTYPQQAGMTCTGAFSVVFGAQTTVNCQADLWFTDGFVNANQSIVANALGNILINDVSFVAPVIQFNAGGNFITSIQPLWLTGQTTINASGVGLNGPIQVSATGSLTINTPAIPEPSTWALMGLGLVGLSLAARRRV